jgi:TMEM175 potassium channel family protein
MLLLLTVVFIPYPTGILGEALRQGAGAKTAAVFYSASMALNAYAWTGLWLYASSKRRLLVDTFPEPRRRSATVLFTLGTVVYTISIAIGFINAYACLGFQSLLAVYYALDPLSRRAAASD